MGAAPPFLSPLVFWRPEGVGSQPEPWKVAASEAEESGQREGREESPCPQKDWKGLCAGEMSVPSEPSLEYGQEAAGEQIQVNMKIKVGTLVKGYLNEVFSSEATLPLPLLEAPKVRQQLQIFVKNLG